MYFITKISKETASNYVFSKLFFTKHPRFIYHNVTLAMQLNLRIYQKIECWHKFFNKDFKFTCTILTSLTWIWVSIKCTTKIRYSRNIRACKPTLH